MDSQACLQKLYQVLDKDITKKEYGSKLFSEARGDNRSDCVNAIGGISKISDFVQKYNPQDSNTLVSGEVLKVPTLSDYENKVNQTNSSTLSNNILQPTESKSFIPADIASLGSNILVGVFSIILLIILLKLVRYMAAFLYDIYNNERIIYLRVMLPRSDDKVSREQEKEIAKDMKEKIGRIAQVFDNMHKLGESTMWENILRWAFRKPKVTLIMHYESGYVSFILGLYPEYKQLIEGAIAAQYAAASIETIPKPNFFPKKYVDIVPLEPIKDTVYPIKVFKQMIDDPMNNILDSIGKIPAEDTFTIFIPIKPEGDSYNNHAKKFAEALYKKDDTFLKKTTFLGYILMPWKIIDFMIHGASKAMLGSAAGGKDMVRMVKSEEEALNIMGEEAGKHAFQAGLMLASSSDDKQRVENNVLNMVATFTIFRDEYNNELDQNETIISLFGFFLKPLWKFAATFFLPSFFFKNNIFTLNQLASLYHFPDSTYNRAPIIKWMDYKVLAAPAIPEMKEYSGYIMTGILAEEYKKGVVSDLIQGMNHWAVGTKEEDEEILVPIAEYSGTDIESKEVVEKDGKKFVKSTKKVTKTGFKIFKDGAFLGINVYRNQYTPIYIKKNDRTRHHYVIGKSGGGKSVYIGALARQDVWNGDGICVIDPHGDLVEGILEYIPKERARDIIYFDAGNEDRPMGLNLYEIDKIDQADRIVNDATEIFIKMFGSEVFGPRIQEYFKYGSLTLLEDFDDRPTLLDVPRLFTDETYRDFKTKKVKNAVVKNFREKTYNAMGDREKQEIIPYFTSKFVSFNTNRLIRNIIGQTKSGFKFREAMDSGKILLVSLSKGKIGEINAQLLGMILVSQIYNAAMGRADVPEDQRRDFYLYVDEFQNFVSGTFADILSEARKYRLSLVMAHQYIAQLESGSKAEGGKADVKAAVFGNVGTMQSFKVGAPDAEFLEKEYAPVLSAQDIVGISNYKAYIKLNINNSTSRVFSMDTVWTQDYRNKKIAGILKEYSAKKYGRAREYVDAEIIARLGLSVEEEKAPEAEETTPEQQAPEATQVPETQA